MANYLVTDTQLKAIADKIRAKTGTVGGIEFTTEFLSEIEKLTDTRDADAAAGDIRLGKTAYVNKSKITGNMSEMNGGTYSPGAGVLYLVPANTFVKTALNVRALATATASVRIIADDYIESGSVDYRNVNVSLKSGYSYPSDALFLPSPVIRVTGVTMIGSGYSAGILKMPDATANSGRILVAWNPGGAYVAFKPELEVSFTYIKVVT